MMWVKEDQWEMGWAGLGHMGWDARVGTKDARIVLSRPGVCIRPFRIHWQAGVRSVFQKTVSYQQVYRRAAGNEFNE